MIKQIISIVALMMVIFNVDQRLYSQEYSDVSIIPQPVSLVRGEGAFELKPSVCIEILDKESGQEQVAAYLSKKLSIPTGFIVPVRQVTAFSPGQIHMSVHSSKTGEREGYHLTVTKDAVTITADSSAGLFYGVQTLLQLLPKEIIKASKAKKVQWMVPCVTIRDYPRFAWRGAMFDVSRHFFTVDQVKEFIDNMVRFKFNLLHMHLSDDQGWRIEIKSLPKLTEVGAWRPERTGQWGKGKKPDPAEPKMYGGFYTHEDIRALVRYAQEQFVTILPEIDVPGHSLAAIASYPELSCTPGSYQVNAGEKHMQWHSKGFYALIDNTLCPANEKVYPFLDKVFTEIAALFPFEYIHMGGDECAKNFWEKSSAVKALMQKEGLKSMSEVQSYFVQRVKKIIESKGKKMIGWDEILDGGLSEGAAVMSWRGMRGGIKAAKLGHKVVMSPSTHSYYDLYQGDPIAEPPTYSSVRLRDAYKFDPVPEGVDEDLVLGGQGNLWTEHIHNMRHAQYMMWPRALAVADAVWSPGGKKNWPNFVKRVEREFERMDEGDIKYSRSMYDPIFKASKNGTQVKLTMETEIEGLDIHYSYDGSNPDNYYSKYEKPLIVPEDAVNVKVVTYREGQPVGKQIDMPVSELKKRAGLK